MSAFLVSHVTIERILGALKEDNHDAREFHAAFPADTPDILGSNMRRMNIDALVARYGDRIPESRSCDMREWTPRPTEPWVAYKAMQCFLYQCHEGDVPKRALFQALERFTLKFGASLAMQTKQWDAAGGWE